MLDLSDRAVLAPLARLLSAVRRTAGETPLLLVGATARDLLLVHAHGIEPRRATEDTDLALAVPTWQAFQRLREALIASADFVAGDAPQQLWFGEQRLDIIPFGGVERADRSIAWPTPGGEVMNAAGLAEARSSAVGVRLPGGVSIDVASLPAQAVLKVWAWADRRRTAPGRDASDLWMLLRYYTEAGNEERLYGAEGEAALEAFAFDPEPSGAWLLGKDARIVLARGPDPERSLESLEAILKPQIDPDGDLGLVAQMPGWDRERQLALLAAFCSGLFNGKLPRP